MSRPELWLYLLGAITVLTISLRRVLHRQTPLSDELYSKQVAIDHVHSGVAWVRADGNINSINPALAKTVGSLPKEILGQDWEKLFPVQERPKVLEAYRQALLMGRTAIETKAERIDGTLACVSVLLITIHDSKTRLVGHYILLEDRTRELELEDQVEKLIVALESASAASKS
ncbi:MAG TPA: PAS domain-containing protein [Bryobacteraceae bacterium]|jgi:PAS domain S-box-containing protein